MAANVSEAGEGGVGIERLLGVQGRALQQHRCQVQAVQPAVLVLYAACTPPTILYSNGLK